MSMFCLIYKPYCWLLQQWFPIYNKVICIMIVQRIFKNSCSLINNKVCSPMYFFWAQVNVAFNLIVWNN